MGCESASSLNRVGITTNDVDLRAIACQEWSRLAELLWPLLPRLGHSFLAGLNQLVCQQAAERALATLKLHSCSLLVVANQLLLVSFRYVRPPSSCRRVIE